MLRHDKTWLAAVVLASGFFLITTTPTAVGQDKKKEEGEANKEVLFKKAEELAKEDEKDSKMKASYRKLYKVKLTEGNVYRIDLSSKEFDTFLRLEDSTGKEVAFNDDIDLANKILDSRILYFAPKTGEYRIIVTTYEPAKTGAFALEMKLGSAKEGEEARFASRLERFPDTSLAEQKKFVDEVTKDFLAKGEDLAFKDAQTAAMIFFLLDDSQVEFARATGKTFIKIFEGAADKKVASLVGFLQPQLKKLDKIGTPIEISGKTTAGKEIDLKKLKGKVVLVDFWGTWCPPCIAEMPNIVKAYEKYHSKGFEVIGVASDKNDEVVIEFLKQNKLPWGCINTEDSRKLIDSNEVTSFPSPFLVGPDGRIVSTRARGPQLERLLERLLSAKK